MDDTGYYWLGDGDDRLLVAAHEIAVPHMPAHAHAHPGQICLWIDGRRVLTDTGVYKYAAGEYRQRARSIRSHNTIQVGEREPVRMASSFWLWGQIDPSVTFEESGSRLELAYSVGGVGRPEYRHRREIEYGSGVWSVEERVESHKSPVVSRLHVHPRLNAKAVDNRVEVMDKSDDPILSVVSFGDDTISIEDAPYYSEYGTECIRDAIAIRPSDSEFFQFQLDLSNTRTRS